MSSGRPLGSPGGRRGPPTPAARCLTYPFLRAGFHPLSPLPAEPSGPSVRPITWERCAPCAQASGWRPVSAEQSDVVACGCSVFGACNKTLLPPGWAAIPRRPVLQMLPCRMTRSVQLFLRFSISVETSIPQSIAAWISSACRAFFGAYLSCFFVCHTASINVPPLIVNNG